MAAFADGLKIFLGQVWTFVDLQCALGSYTLLARQRNIGVSGG